jgi:predicted ArsR family transcriptional regulator
MATGWDRRFFASTRGQVVALLRRGRRTVEDLAQSLGLTDNAVRSHLSALERDGLVRQEGVLRGTNRPAYTYELTSDAERLFPKPYGAVLAELLALLGDRIPPAELEAALRDVGHRLAAGQSPPSGPAEQRAERAVLLLNDLGGAADGERMNGHYVIQGWGCPLSAATAVDTRACKLAETFLADVTGLPVTEQCDHGGEPRCRFEIALDPPSQAASPSASAEDHAPVGEHVSTP